MTYATLLEIPHEVKLRISRLLEQLKTRGDLEILRLQWMDMRKVIKPIRETEP